MWVDSYVSTYMDKKNNISRICPLQIQNTYFIQDGLGRDQVGIRKGVFRMDKEGLFMKHKE